MDDHDDYCLKDYRYHFQPDLLKGKTAFISGGASGIGFRISELLMRHGCDIVIVSRNIKKLEEVRQEVHSLVYVKLIHFLNTNAVSKVLTENASAQKLREATGRKCHVIKVDVREYNIVLNAVKEAVKMFGPIDILINAAAGNFLCPVSSMSTNAYKTVMEIDAVGTFNCTKAVFETGMNDHGGCIINISATLHYTGTPMQAHAGSAKAAIDALTRHLAVEWGPLNIRVNSVSPGPIEGTEGFRKLGGFNKDAIPLIISRIPLQRMGTRTDIAEACLFLASPLASYVTGAILVVDGGNWLTDGQTLEQRMKVASKL